MQQIGVQPILLLAQIVNFAIIVYVLNRLLYKPIIKFLDKRREEIAAGVKLAEKMREEEEKTLEKREKTLESARKEAQRLLVQAKERAKEKEKELIADAYQTAQGIVSRGKQEVILLHRNLEKELKAQAVDLAALMVKRLVPTIMSTGEQHKLLEKQLKELEAKS